MQANEQGKSSATVAGPVPQRFDLKNDSGRQKLQQNISPILVYIASDVRSGSTLLDLILGSHPMIASVGEIQFLTDHFNKTGTGYSWDWKCTCGKYFDECPFWSNVNRKIEKKTGEPIRAHETWVRRKGNLPFPLMIMPNHWMRIYRKRFAEIQKGIAISDICWKIVDAIQSTTGKGIVVDSSKNAEQLRYLYYWRPSSIRLIHLIRDGRGVVYSKMTREGDSARKATKNWVLENIKIIAMKTMMPRKQCILIRYEDLCKNPQKEIDRLYNFLRIPSAESLLSKADRHNVCGSPHRFDRQNTEIQLDRRWETRMPQADRTTFALIGGWLNFLFGYR